MDLVDEKHVACGEVEQDRPERALMVDRRTRADLDCHSELVGDDVCERGLAQAGGTTQEHVLDGLTAASSSLEQDAQVLAHLKLSDVLREHSRPERQVVLVVVYSRIQHPIFIPHEIGSFAEISWGPFINAAHHFLPSALSAAARASWVEGVIFQSTASRPRRASWGE